MPLRFLLRVITLVLAGITAALAQAPLPPAQELITLKGGYADKKRDLEELRIRAYIPILLKAVGPSATWKPGHPNWAPMEQRIAVEWRALYAGYMARMGRDTTFAWIDEALAREYARLFTAHELAALQAFYRSPAGEALVALEKQFLAFYPAELVRSLSRVMIGSNALSERETAAFRSPENRARRAFALLFESDTMLYEESLRIGGNFVAANSNVLQQGAVATAAESLDALRATLAPALLAEIQAFLKTEAAQKDREFLAVAVQTAIPAGEDAALAKQEEAAFYKGLAALSAQWRVAANAAPESDAKAETKAGLATEPAAEPKSELNPDKSDFDKNQ